MTTEFRPEDGRPDPALSVIISERRQLINLAYPAARLARAVQPVEQPASRRVSIPLSAQNC
jgi:hypothetical protein